MYICALRQEKRNTRAAQKGVPSSIAAPAVSAGVRCWAAMLYTVSREKLYGRGISHLYGRDYFKQRFW